MKGTASLALAALIVATVAATISQCAAQFEPDGTVIRIGHDSKESSPLHQAMLVFAKEVHTRSNSSISVEIFAARQLGDVSETTEMVQQGNLQMTVGASVLLTSIVPEFNVLDMFYLFDDERHAHAALDHKLVGGRLLDAMQRKGFHGVGFMEVGFRNVTSSKRPIERLDDLVGLRIRSAANPTQISAWEAVGAAPVPLSWGEIFTSLQQGLIDSQESAVYSIFAERFFEVQRYLSLTGHMYTNYVWFANQEFWKSLNDDERAIIEDAALIAIGEQRRLSANQNSQILGVLQGSGVRVNAVSEIEKGKIGRRMNQAVFDEIRRRSGAQLFDTLLFEIKKLSAESANEDS